MTPGLPLRFHNTLQCPLCLSSQKPSENSNKRPELRVGCEWTAQRKTNLSLLCICWLQHSLFFFSLTLYTPPLLYISLFPPSLTNTLVFLALLIDFTFYSISPGGIVRRTTPHVYAKTVIHCERSSSDLQSALSQTTRQQCCRALLKGHVLRTIAHTTPNPPDTQGRA